MGVTEPLKVLSHAILKVLSYAILESIFFGHQPLPSVSHLCAVLISIGTFGTFSVVWDSM